MVPGERNSGDCLTQEAQIRRLEVSEIRENAGKVGVRHSEPRGQRRTILIHRGCGNPAAARVGVVGPTQLEGGKLAENLAALAPALARVVPDGADAVLTADAGIGAS